MDLTKVEKLLLANQYEILKQLDPSHEKDCDLLLKCLYDGYEFDFEQLLPHFSDPIAPGVQTEVREILQMFRMLHPGYGAEPAAVFVGFDGNEETEHYAYATFLLEDRGLWRESRRDDSDYNTHTPVLDDYRAMLAIWNAVTDKFRLTQDEIRRMVEVAPIGSAKR
jgi:hypothetical protein